MSALRLAVTALVALACLAFPPAARETVAQDPAAALAALQRVEKAMRLQLAEWRAAEGAPELHLVMLGGRIARIEWRRIETLLGLAQQAEKDPGIVQTMRMAMPDEGAVLAAIGVDLTKSRDAPSADEVHKRLTKLAQQHAPQVEEAIGAREQLLAALTEQIAALAAQLGVSPVATDPAMAANAERLFAACKALGDKDAVCRCQADAAAGVLDAPALGAVAGFFEGMAAGRDDFQTILKEGNVTEEELTSHFATVGAAAKHCKG